MKAKRPLEQIQKTQGAKRKQQFYLFSLRVLHGFPRKSNEDEFSRKSNGGWISWESNGGCKIKNNMIRLVPARIESRGEK